jgi:hypothetical protein
VLSHRAAATLWGMLRFTVFEAIVAKQQHPRRGLFLRCCRFEPDEVVTVKGIPVTGVSRTLFDLAAVLPRRQVERAIHEAEIRRLTDRLSLPDLLKRYPRRPGTPVIKAILGSGVTLTRSDLEAAFLDFLHANCFGQPETNAWIFARDLVWRSAGTSSA